MKDTRPRLHFCSRCLDWHKPTDHPGPHDGHGCQGHLFPPRTRAERLTQRGLPKAGPVGPPADLALTPCTNSTAN